MEETEDRYDPIQFASRHVLMAVWSAIRGREYNYEPAIRVMAARIAGWKYP